jgi:TolB-like protein/Tfp pilus assembly protein PilF
MALLVHAERVTRTGTTLGTVQYMSPEQAIGGQVDGRSDIWSLGIVLYEMLAGQPPFNGESEASVLYAIVNEEETPIEQLRTDLPQPLAALVHKAIAKNPQQRYQTMVELVEDLGAIKTGRKIDVKRPSSPKRRAKGRRALWSVAAALVLILLANFADRIFFHREIIDAVAVLPFRNLSGDTEQEWLADALTEQITTGLQSIPTLLVRPNMSSRQYKNTDKKLANIANELRVQAVIEGTILRRANYVRLNIHLIHALKNQQLWSASFEQDIEDVFALRNEIVRALIGEINSKLLPEAKARMTQTEHVKQVAFEAAQRGRWTIASSQGAEKKIDQGIELLRKAIAFDPDYAAAHAQLGWGYLTKAIAFADSRRLLPLMRTEAETALRLDENLAEAHCLMARVHGFDYDWPRMETELQQALSLNPNDVTAYFQYGQFLLCHGRFNEGISFVKRSIDLDPLADPDSPELAVAYSLAGRIDESINLLDKVLKKYPENIDLHAFQAANYAEKRKIPEMQKEIDLVMAANPSPYSSSFFNVAGAHAIAGHRTQALAMLTEIIRATDENYVDPLYIASYAGLVEQVDEAIKWYERAFIEKSSWLMYTRVFTRVGCEKLRADPRFQSFLSRIHL